MKKKYLLTALITILALTALCLLSGCGIFGGLGGNGGNDPIDSGATRYLHFVDADGNELLNYKVDRYYSETDLSQRLSAVVTNYHTPKNGKYLDGTTFSTVKSEMSDYFVKHDPDTWVNNYEAYTVVMELVAITHTLDFYAEGQLVQHFELSYEQWGNVTPPAVPQKDGYAGKWQPLPQLFEDSRVDAVYVPVTPISSAADWSKIAENPDGYFVLENDVDFGGGAIPIVTEFNGTLDGQGHKVYNFSYSNSQSDANFGIFCVNNGEISNIVFSDGSYTVATVRDFDVLNVGFLTGVNNGLITDVQVDDLTVAITCYYSKSTNLPHEMELKFGVGVLAGNNKGQIEYVTVTNTVYLTANTTINANRMDGYPNGEMTIFASYGGIVGANSGTVNHATSSVANLASGTTFTEQSSSSDDRAFRLVNFYLRLGCIAGSNESGSSVVNSLADGKVRPSWNGSLGRDKFVSAVDVGGIVGANWGIVSKCHAGANTYLSSYCNAETRVGGVVGANEASVMGCYSEAQLVIGNRSQEATYYGGVVGLNSGNVSNCYAIVDKLNTLSLMDGGSPIANAGKLYFGGVFGYVSSNGAIYSCFAKLDVAALDIGASNVFGNYQSARIDIYCYVYLTENATGHDSCDKVTVCATEQELFAALAGKGFDTAGFTMSDGYPVLPNVGNSK